jgi:hypothetical protein
MFFHSSQLIGQILVILRHIIIACKRSVESIARDFDSKHAHEQRMTLLAQISPLISVVLIIGRISWLFKIRGRFGQCFLFHSHSLVIINRFLIRFLEDALSPPQPTSSAILQSMTFCTEDQLRSAFEIADTNGDGIVTNMEALEVNKINSFDLSIVILIK